MINVVCFFFCWIVFKGTPNKSLYLRAAKCLPDWLTPISTGAVPLEGLQVSSAKTMPVKGGQCILEDISVAEFTSQPWWRDFHEFMVDFTRSEAGQPEPNKLAKGNIVTWFGFQSLI